MSTAAIATAVSVGAVVVTAVFGSLAARRAQFDRVIDVIGFASGGCRRHVKTDQGAATEN